MNIHDIRGDRHMKKQPLYLKLADSLEDQIKHNILKPGDKLPSLRTVSHEKGISLNSVQKAYYELERRGLIDPQPKSGYFVANSLLPKHDLPNTTQPVAVERDDNMEHIFFSAFEKNILKLFLMFLRNSIYF